MVRAHAVVRSRQGRSVCAPKGEATVKILIVEDERRIASFVEDALRGEGYQTAVAHTGPDGVALGGDPGIDLVVLDVMLPSLDGYGVLAELRSRRPDLPVLMLTARDDLRSKVAGLGSGADDYLTKPFALEELLARIKALLRRRLQATTLAAGGLILDVQARVVQVGHRRVELTAREFALLEYLMRRPNQVVSRRQLLAEVWQLEFEPGSTVLETTMNRLRHKLAPDGAAPIETVRGAGYRLAAGR